MSDTRRFVGESAIYLIASLATRAVSFLLVPLYTRVLSPEAVGTVALGNTIGALASLILGLGAHSALSRYVPTQSKEEQGRWIGTILALLTAVPVGFLPLAASVVWAAPSANATLHLWPDLALIFIAAWASVYSAILSQWLVSTHQARHAASFNLLSVAVQLVATWVAVVTLQLSVFGVFAASALAQVVLALVAAVVLQARLTLQLDRSVLRPLLVYALPVILHLMANWTLSISDRVFIERVKGARALALYAVAYLFNLGLTTFTAALTQALAPLFIRAASADEPKQILRVGWWFVGAMSGVCVCAALLAPELLAVVAPQALYQDALSLVPWLLLGAYFQGFYFLLSQGSWYAGSTRQIAVVTATAAAVNVALNAWLVPIYGALGAAWSTATSYLVLAVVHDRIAQRRHHIAWPYARYALVSALVIGALYVAQTRSAIGNVMLKL